MRGDPPPPPPPPPSPPAVPDAAAAAAAARVVPPPPAAAAVVVVADAAVAGASRVLNEEDRLLSDASSNAPDAAITSAFFDLWERATGERDTGMQHIEDHQCLSTCRLNDGHAHTHIKVRRKGAARGSGRTGGMDLVSVAEVVLAVAADVVADAADCCCC